MMSSNFNPNQRTREYSYKSQVYEDYPTMNYDTENSLQDSNIVSPRMRTMRRLDTQSMRSGTLNDNSIKSKDEFTIFGSFIRQKSERKSENEYRNSSFERTLTIPKQAPSFKNLPVKAQRGSEVNSMEYNQIIQKENTDRILSQPQYSTQVYASPDSLFDRRQNYNGVDSTSVPVALSPEVVVPLRKTQMESLPQQNYNEDFDIKDKEISRLNKNADRMNKKMQVLEENNKKLQEHLKNLLNERKQLLNQISNSEFEEIIEEEEVQKARPNSVPKENITRIEYVREEMPKPVEVSHINCIQRGIISLDDVPQKVLESFRNDILRREREIFESEKRSIVETLKTQQQKQIMSLQAENEAQKNAFQQVSVQSYKKTHFNHIVSETNLEKTPLPKPVSKSIGVFAYPSGVNKQCQCEGNQVQNSLNKYVSKKTITKWQKSVIEKVIQAVENNDYESLINTMDEALCKPNTSIGVGYTPICSNKSSNTDVIKKADVMVESNIIVEVVKPRISQESRAVLVKPMLTQRGCQPEDTFKFETGTITDQIFCRSQGMMTVADYTDNRTPSNLEIDSVINKSTNRSESRKQTISRTSYLTSPTKDSVNIHERAISPRINKFNRKSPDETVHEQILEVKTVKNENLPKSKSGNVIEEIEHVIEKKTQQITSVLDSNKVPKKEIPTTIECWETIAHLKDGQVIDETETYHNRLVSTDADEIKAHLTKHEQSQSNESSPIKKTMPENPILSSFQNENASGVSLNFQDTKSMFERNNSTSRSFNTGKLNTQSSRLGMKKNNNSQQDSTSFQKSSVSTEISKTTSKLKETSNFQESENLKKSIPIIETKVLQKPLLNEKTFQESEKRINISSSKRSTDITDSNIRKIPTKETSYQESKETVNSTILRNPGEVKEIKINQTISKPFMEQKSHNESQNSFVSDNMKNQKDFKEIKVQKAFSTTPYIKSTDLKSEDVINYSTQKKPVEIRGINVVQNLSKPFVKETSFEKSEEIISFRKSGKSDEIKELKIQPNFSTAFFKKPTYESEINISSGNFNNNKEILGTSGYENKYTVIPQNIMSATENSEYKIQYNVSAPSVKESTYHESEEIITFEKSENPDEIKEINIQSNFSTTPFKKPPYESETSFSSGNFKNNNEIFGTSGYESKYTVIPQTLMSSTEDSEYKMQHNVSAPSVKESTYHESEEIINFEKLGNPDKIKEIKVQSNYSAVPFKKPSYESESSFSSGNFKNNSEIFGTSGYESKFSVKPQIIMSASENSEYKLQHNVSAPSVKESTYHESEEIITTTTTSSRVPIEFRTIDPSNNNFQTINKSTSSTKQSSPTNSIGVLTLPSSFQSYSSSKGKSNFSSSKQESFSFQSTGNLIKGKGIPIEVKTSSTTESSGYNIPVNVTSLPLGTNKVTRVPINIINNVRGSSSITSSNSAFRSLSSNQEIERTSGTPITKENKKSDYSEIILSEVVFENCSRLMLWLKSFNITTTSTIDDVPSNLITVSSSLVDWWVDVTVKMDSVQLMSTVQYLISTFSKNLLKYLIINLDQQGNSCLHYIIGHQMWESFDVLDSTNLVDPNVYNTQGFTLLMVACTIKISGESNLNKLRKLVSNANVNLKSKIQGQTAIFLAALHNNSQTIQILYTMGADINIRDNNDMTPLMIASSKNNVDAVTTLLSFTEASADLKNKDGKTAFDIADEAHFTDLIEVFQKQSKPKTFEQSSTYSKVMQNSYKTSSYSGTRKN